MRILITTDVVGGVWNYTLTLVRELARRGHTLAVAVLGDPGAERLNALPAGVELVVRDLRLEWMPGGLEDVQAGTRWLAELAGDWGADVAHLNQLAYRAEAMPAPALVVAHSDVFSWFREVRGEPAPAEWEEYRAAVRTGLAGAGIVVAPTAYQAERTATHYGRSRVRVIHNGIELPPAAGAGELEGGGRTTDRASRRPLVLVAGRAWDKAKGVALLDRAVGLLGDDAPSVHLVGPVRGPGGESLEVEHLVAQGEVDGDTMDRFYRNARLYVGPSLYEPFGLAPLEAAAHGCGLLLSGIGSFRELWTGAAVFFDPLTAEALADRLAGVLADPEGLDERATRALERSHERYTAARMADAYESTYLELTGPRRGAGSREPRPVQSTS